MKKLYVDIVGSVAAVLTTISFIPQIMQVVKTGNTRDISLYMYIVLTTGILLWLIYGIFLRAFPIIFGNSVAIVFCVYILIKKIESKD